MKKSKYLGCGCLTLVGSLLMLGFLASRNTTARKDERTKPTATEKESNAVQSGDATPTNTKNALDWSYSDDVDGMGRKRSFASVKSVMPVSFGFPYQGSQHGTLTIRRTDQQGTDILFGFERAQFVCGISDCMINVQFDSGPIERYRASKPSDYSTNVLFIINQKRFLDRLRKAQVLRIQATFYQDGDETVTFWVGGYKGV